MNLRCTACRVLVPATKSVASKAVGSVVGGVLGLSTRSVAGTVISALVGLAVGHVVDEAIRPICGHCGRPLAALA